MVANIDGYAVKVTIADAGGDTTTFPMLATAATGNLTPATDSGLSYNATTEVLTAAGGFSSGAGALSRILFDQYTDSTVGGAEADIYTNTLAASTLGTNGDKVIASYSGNFVTVGTEIVQLKAYFAGTAVWDSTGIAVTTGTTSWRVGMEIIRVSSTVVRYSVALNTTGASGFVYETTGELTGLTLSNTAVIKVTGTSSGVGSGSGDIIGRMGYGQLLPAKV